jgi:hypothetical protein
MPPAFAPAIELPFGEDADADAAVATLVGAAGVVASGRKAAAFAVKDDTGGAGVVAAVAKAGIVVDVVGDVDDEKAPNGDEPKAEYGVPAAEPSDDESADDDNEPCFCCSEDDEADDSACEAAPPAGAGAVDQPELAAAAEAAAFVAGGAKNDLNDDDEPLPLPVADRPSPEPEPEPDDKPAVGEAPSNSSTECSSDCSAASSAALGIPSCCDCCDCKMPPNDKGAAFACEARSATLANAPPSRVPSGLPLPLPSASDPANWPRFAWYPLRSNAGCALPPLFAFALAFTSALNASPNMDEGKSDAMAKLAEAALALALSAEDKTLPPRADGGGASSAETAAAAAAAD